MISRSRLKLATVASGPLREMLRFVSVAPHSFPSVYTGREIVAELFSEGVPRRLTSGLSTWIFKAQLTSGWRLTV